MPSTRLVSAVMAAGVIAAGVSMSTAWAGGPSGTVEDNYPSEAVGTGVFAGELDGFKAFGMTNEEASANVIAACQAAGGTDCTADEVTNDNLCIASVADPDTSVVAGGAGPTVGAAVADAYARAAANGTPLGSAAAPVITDCP